MPSDGRLAFAFRNTPSHHKRWAMLRAACRCGKAIVVEDRGDGVLYRILDDHLRVPKSKERY